MIGIRLRGFRSRKLLKASASRPQRGATSPVTASVGRVRPPFVDCHSHVCPSGDDGASTVAEGALLCREAARHGTRILFATPHVWPNLTLTPEREMAVRASFAELAPVAGLELRLGFELTPSAALLREDLWRYELAGTGCVLMEVPFVGSGEPLVELAKRAEAQGLVPVIAHPERSEAAETEPDLAWRLARRGWPVQVNSTSLLGRHGPRISALAWELVEAGAAAVVGSDGHRQTRPPHLDDAWNAVAERIGEDRARPMFDGTALGLAAVDASEPRPTPTPSRAATRGA
jgi:protein-tyrosine phosphatase